MKVSELLDRSIALLGLVSHKSVKHASEAGKLIQGLTHLKGWAYPQLTTDDLVKVTRCKNCRFYKRYKRKKDPKAVPFQACSLNRIKRPEDFYCAEGMEK